ncbi:hypothetical protein [Streptomyces sp. NPDC002553]
MARRVHQRLPPDQVAPVWGTAPAYRKKIIEAGPPGVADSGSASPKVA